MWGIKQIRRDNHTILHNIKNSTDISQHISVGMGVENQKS